MFDIYTERRENRAFETFAYTEFKCPCCDCEMKWNDRQEKHECEDCETEKTFSLYIGSNDYFFDDRHTYDEG